MQDHIPGYISLIRFVHVLAEEDKNSAVFFLLGNQVLANGMPTLQRWIEQSEVLSQQASVAVDQKAFYQSLSNDMLRSEQLQFSSGDTFQCNAQTLKSVFMINLIFNMEEISYYRVYLTIHYISANNPRLNVHYT